MQRPDRNVFVITAGCIVLLLVLILKVMPIVNGIILAFKDFNPVTGISGSSFTGLKNMTEALTTAGFPRLLLNTVRLNLLYLITVLVVSFVLALSLTSVSKVMQNVFITLILIPLFIPGNAMVHICFLWFKGTPVLVNYAFFPFVYALLLTVKNAGIPTVFILKTLQMKRGLIENNGFGKIMAPVVFFLVQLTFILSTDMDIVNSLINPLVYSTGDNLDYSIFRLGFMQMKMGVSQSIWLLQMLAQLIIGFISYILLYSVQKKTFPDDFAFENTSPISQNVNPAGFIAPVLYSVFLAWFVFKPLVIDGLIGILGSTVLLQSNVLINYIAYIFVYGIIAMAGVPLSVLMAKSIVMENAFGKLVRIIFVFLFIAGGMGIHHYLLIKGAGLFNSYLCYIPYYIIPVTSSLVLAVILYYRKSASETERRSFVWKAAFSLGVLQFINMWNSEYIPLVFTSMPDRMPPVLISKMLAQGLNQNGVDLPGLLGMDLVVSILPVALFLIFRRIITEWILLACTKIRC